MEGKPIWLSKTLWFNLLALVILVAGAFGYVGFEADPWVGNVAPAIVVLVNLVLRLITKEPLRFW